MSTLSSRVPPKQARLVMTELRTRMRPSINGSLYIYIIHTRPCHIIHTHPCVYYCVCHIIHTRPCVYYCVCRCCSVIVEQMSYEEEDTCMSYEEEDSCMSSWNSLRKRLSLWGAARQRLVILTYVYVYVHARVHTHTHTHTHTHIHTHTLSPTP